MKCSYKPRWNLKEQSYVTSCFLNSHTCMNTGQSPDILNHVPACVCSGMPPEDGCGSFSYPDREEPWTPRRVPCWTARGWARSWTNPARSGWAWTECSPGTRPWNGTPAPSRSVSGRIRPGPLQQRQRTDAGLPCPPQRGIWAKRAADLWVSAVCTLSQRN